MLILPNMVLEVSQGSLSLDWKFSFWHSSLRLRGKEGGGFLTRTFQVLTLTLVPTHRDNESLIRFNTLMLGWHRGSCWNFGRQGREMSFGRCMDKKAVVHIHEGILLSHQKEYIWISSEVDETGAYYTKWNK